MENVHAGSEKVNSSSRVRGIAEQLATGHPRDLAILNEDGCVIIVPAWSRALHSRAVSVDKLQVMIETITGRTMAELDPAAIEQWAATFLGGSWNG